MTGRPGEPARDRARRVRARARGIWAERLAAAALALKGYRVVARGFSCAGGEIDIVARRRRTLAFVEVKYRRDADAAPEAVTATKRRRIEHAARVYLTIHPGDAASDIRFDAVLLSPWRWPRHVAGAWRP
jgi:putative endonuclease